MNTIRTYALAFVVLASVALPSAAKADSLVISYSLSTTSHRAGPPVYARPAHVVYVPVIVPPRHRVAYMPKGYRHHRHYQPARFHRW